MEKVLLTIVMLGALQGLLLFFALGRITNNRPSNRLLGIFVLLLSLTMAGRVIASSGLVEQFPNFLLLPDAIIFLYGPILYLYFRKLLTEEAPISRETLWHFLPALPLCFVRTANAARFPTADARFFEGKPVFARGTG